MSKEQVIEKTIEWVYSSLNDGEAVEDGNVSSFIQKISAFCSECLTGSEMDEIDVADLAEEIREKMPTVITLNHENIRELKRDQYYLGYKGRKYKIEGDLGEYWTVVEEK